MVLRILQRLFSLILDGWLLFKNCTMMEFIFAILVLALCPT